VPLAQIEIHEVVELTYSALHWVESLVPGRGVREAQRPRQWQRVDVFLQCGHITRLPVLVVGEARVVVGAYSFDLNFEGRTHESLVLLQHPNELATCFELMGYTDKSHAVEDV